MKSGSRLVPNHANMSGTSLRMRVDGLLAHATVTVAWIAERLTMGGRDHLMHFLYLDGKDTDLGNGHQPTLEI